MQYKEEKKRFHGEIWQMVNSFRGKYPTNKMDMYFIIYLLYRHIKDSSSFKSIIESESNSNTRSLLARAYHNYLHDRQEQIHLLEILSNFPLDVIEHSLVDANIISSNTVTSGGEISTVNSVVLLANAIMRPSGDHEVADFCSGIGSFLVAAAENNVSNLKGVEINSSAIALAGIRLGLLKDRGTEINYQLYNEDIFKYSEKNPDKKYDLIFSHFPWGVKNAFPRRDYWADKFSDGTALPNNSDWYFIRTVVNHLKSSGKACVLATQSIEFRKTDDDIRKHFLDNGYIEQVIQLPDNLHDGTGIQTLMLVLSFNNKKIRFYDASTVYSGDRRKKYFTEKNIEEIMDDASPNCNYVLYEDVIRTTRLMPAYYAAPIIKNAKSLAEIAQLFRGQTLRKIDLDQLNSEERTDIELIRPKHIINGMITDVDYLRSLPKNAKLLQTNDILLKRVGTDVDCALYRTYGKNSAIADDNIIVIRCDPGKINIFYLLAYLQSDLGMEQLRANYKGNAIKRISMSDLKIIPVPMLKKAEQETIGNNFAAINQEIELERIGLKCSLEDKTEQLQQWFGR